MLGETDNVGTGVAFMPFATGFVGVFLDSSFSLSRTTRLDVGRLGVVSDVGAVEILSVGGSCNEGAIAFGKANEPDPFLVSILISDIKYYAIV